MRTRVMKTLKYFHHRDRWVWEVHDERGYVIANGVTLDFEQLEAVGRLYGCQDGLELLKLPEPYKVGRFSYPLIRLLCIMLRGDMNELARKEGRNWMWGAERTLWFLTLLVTFVVGAFATSG